MAMVRLGGILCSAPIGFTPIWRINIQHLLTSSISAANHSTVVAYDKKEEVRKKHEAESITRRLTEGREPLNEKSSVMELVFNNLKASNWEDTAKDQSESVKNTIPKSWNDLLEVANQPSISYKKALKSITALNVYMENDKNAASLFKTDDRYLKLSKILEVKNEENKVKNEEKSKSTFNNMQPFFGLENTVDYKDQIAAISPSKAIQMMSGLARNKKRHVPLLQSLSCRLSKTSHLDVKQTADVLYNLATLNFPDEILLQKLCQNLLSVIPDTKKSSVIGSVLNSLGFLRYKDEALLDVLSRWIIENSKIARPQELTSLLLTLATLGHSPQNIEELHEKLLASLKESDTAGGGEWLETVWCLVVLKRATYTQLSSVLRSTFLDKLTRSSSYTIFKRVKLLNINAAAKLLVKDYRGEFLKTDSPIFDTYLERTKDKLLFTRAVTDTLINLLPSIEYANIDVNKGMGFLLDAECYVDEKCNPLLVDNTSGKKPIRIAVMAQYYNDFCRGKQDILGSVLLQNQLLAANGYKVLAVPYTEFSSQDKLLTRVKYLNQKIKSIAAESSTELK